MVTHPTKTKEELVKEFGNLALVENIYFDDPNLSEQENMKLAFETLKNSNGIKLTTPSKEQEAEIEQKN